MYRVVGAISIAMALLLSGCGIIDKELNNRGGYLDYLADDWVKADSKKMRVMRAVALELSLARLAMIAPKNTSDRNLLANRIGDASKRSEHVIACAFDPQYAPCFYFDSAMVDYVTALFDLAVVSLPIDDAKKLLNRISGDVIGSNPVDLLYALIDLGREAIRYGRVAGAIYRDTIELEVQVWLTTPNDPQNNIPPEYRVTKDTVEALSKIYLRGNDDLPAWKEQLAELRARGLEPIPQEAKMSELFMLIGYICGEITNDSTALKNCRVNPYSPPAKKTSSLNLPQPGRALAEMSR